jgi:hypothetical protein
VVCDRRIRNSVSVNLPVCKGEEIHEDRMILTCPHPDRVIEHYYITPQHEASLAEDGTIIIATPHKEDIRALVRELFGTGAPSPVLVFLDGYLRDGYNNVDVLRVSIWLRGRLLATRERHDDEVNLGDGVRIIAGGFT